MYVNPQMEYLYYNDIFLYIFLIIEYVSNNERKNLIIFIILYKQIYTKTNWILIPAISFLFKKAKNIELKYSMSLDINIR
jgi:hypothetical protein